MAELDLSDLFQPQRFYENLATVQTDGQTIISDFLEK